MEPIRSSQSSRLNDAYDGHPMQDKIMQTVKTLTMSQAWQIIHDLAGATYRMARHNPNPEVQAKAKQKLNTGIEALKKYGLKDTCHICRQDRATCTC